jgi:hypothetical protein
MDVICHASPQLVHHLRPILVRRMVIKLVPHRLALAVLQKGPRLFWELTRIPFQFKSI